MRLPTGPAFWCELVSAAHAALLSLSTSTVGDKELLEHFQQFGDVIEAVVIIDHVTKLSRLFGFVTFAREVRHRVFLLA